MQVEQVVGPGPSALRPGRARPNQWYLLSPTTLAVAGDAGGAGDEGAAPALPEPRVGHTASYLPRRRKVLLVGGASPCALYSEVWQLDVQRLSLSLLRPGGPGPAAPERGRYEHCAFLPPAQDPSDKIWVFAGANMEGNLNDLWELDVAADEWRLLDCSGTVPAPRTMHTTTADVMGELVLFGGGSQAASPVADQSVYKLEPSTRTWTTVSVLGAPPAPRQGHVLVGVGGKLFCHGGMAGNKFFADLHVLQDGQWTLTDGETAPSARAGHGAVSVGNFVYIFGGLGPHGSLDDMWKLDCNSLTWEEMVFESDSPRPKPRLDFAMSLVWLPQHFTPQCSNGEAVTQNGAQSEDSSSADSEHDLPFILLHGGMDDLGTIYNDFHVFCLEDSTN